mmetsp:Transcript_37409/g.83250  ORF Transcript_37409/g.83250 Transcript_37409/m.83250 type:complete len:284 (+) Transcript_37409:144-995(+)|eukprot:CAMPEP_0202893390 /NCGR_PEP_ID=MMETSP1392-20130828/2985_1 /ASSEMBLY_ACC=CAM_ASM_000868 /TAXON_ID=225041 /ORGANISM="Chlamydomonas chlamydogama, Strain SAG 11-48b" /LENGTH=283 /DNA_ID=CAMNT_0049577703 /DNA_START=80 /DNA_END=931 /DNA_ORIENTATION=+
MEATSSSCAVSTERLGSSSRVRTPSGLSRLPSRAGSIRHHDMKKTGTKSGLFRRSPAAPTLTARVATPDDIEGLLAVEASAFPNPAHRASRETILRRLTTSPNTCLVALHPQLGIVGSMYNKLCVAEVIVAHKYSWEALNNGGDFTPPQHYDSAYTLGLQTMRGVRNVSRVLELFALQHAITQLGCKQVFGGPRLPGYRKYFSETGGSVEQYIASGQDKVLSTIMRNGSVPGVFRCSVVAPLVDYWADPDSMNYAALLKISWSPLMAKIPGLSTLVFHAAKHF